jgi:hypothetical protein
MANGVYRGHGPNRRPVGGSRTVVSSQTTSRWARATVAGHARGAERSLLGFTHGCSLARSAVSLSVLSDLSSALPTLAAQWAADSLAAKTGRGLARPRKARSERILHRRQLQRREKGALASALQNAAKAAKSWQSQTAMVFLSPCTWPALRLMKLSSSNPRLTSDSLPKPRNA